MSKSVWIGDALEHTKTKIVQCAVTKPKAVSPRFEGGEKEAIISPPASRTRKEPNRYLKSLSQTGAELLVCGFLAGPPARRWARTMMEVHEVNLPVDFSPGIRVFPDGSVDLTWADFFPPSAKPSVAGTPGTAPPAHISPWRTGPELPESSVDDPPMVLLGASNIRSPWGKKGQELLPSLVFPLASSGHDMKSRPEDVAHSA